MSGPAGFRVHLITIQARTGGKDSEGGITDGWADHLPNIFAGVKNLSGNEKMATSQGGQAAVARTEFDILYRDGIDETMRIQYKGKIYNIDHVNNLNEENKRLILTSNTGLNDGR
jgi:SPP1 family predicted phage head-tail adaptor